MAKWLTRWSAKPVFMGSNPIRCSRFSFRGLRAVHAGWSWKEQEGAPGRNKRKLLEFGVVGACRPGYRLGYKSGTDGEVANALVCKTSIHGFKSHSVLQRS